jgi:hypothetical protein
LACGDLSPTQPEQGPAPATDRSLGVTFRLTGAPEKTHIIHVEEDQYLDLPRFRGEVTTWE